MINFDASELVAYCPEVNPGKLTGGELDRDLERRIGEWLPGEWHAKRNRVMPIRVMRDGHLANTIRFLIRGAARARAESVGEFLGTAGSETWGPRGDAAQDAVEAETRIVAAETWRTHLGPHFWACLLEGRRRGLEGIDRGSLAKYGDREDALADRYLVGKIESILAQDKLIRVRDALES